MSPQILLQQFMVMFPHLNHEVELMFPNGKNAIRLRFTNKREYMFTYYDEKNWRFETINSYHQSLKRS